MKILTVADEESRYLWDYYDDSIFEDVDFIISAGDLKAKFLSFLTTVSRKPVFYVPGNHDHKYLTDPPYGCENLDDQIFFQNGVRMLGLGGSYRYKHGPFQYTEKEMRKKLRRLKVMIRQFDGIDILVTHAPAKGNGDGDDLCHRGFEVFNEFIQEYKPSYMIHGHQHLTYNVQSKRIIAVDRTIILNAFNYHFVDYKSNNYVYPKLSGLAKFWNTIRFYQKYSGTEVIKQYRAYKAFKKAESN